jgi:hypothetical protein
MKWIVPILIIIPLCAVALLYLELRFMERVNAELPEELRFELIGWYGISERMRFLREVEAYWRRHHKK